ncbi:hypothetical protein EZJ19_12905 [Parasulfuritortus cantonensis]|uniref:Uncharacterized protein n=1 Tax=Parasulfuritortus cantonensis TaxID=2528202 RepID=A0A4V2NV57_9PROT|nr:hypothetical protein [Parasulfuritortus cantonensis]TCJ12236.1 hypothetical protein EZJ19_12905 [Parasulfuritortus cantonensis]
MEITVYRDRPVASEPRQLPAALYNLAHSLLARSPGTLFVPIRAAQYLAIVDAEEIIFLDHQHKSWVEVAWRNFRPQARAALDDPVPYEAVYYQADGTELMRRLQPEFAKALSALSGKERLDGQARVLKFERPAG